MLHHFSLVTNLLKTFFRFRGLYLYLCKTHIQRSVKILIIKFDLVTCSRSRSRHHPYCKLPIPPWLCPLLVTALDLHQKTLLTWFVTPRAGLACLCTLYKLQYREHFFHIWFLLLDIVRFCHVFENSCSWFIAIAVYYSVVYIDHVLLILCYGNFQFPDIKKFGVTDILLHVFWWTYKCISVGNMLKP